MSEETESVVQDNTATTETQTTETVDTTQPETNAEVSATAEQETEAQSEPQGAPEQYSDFTVPENFSAPIEDFKSWAKENNMTQEKAQATVDFYTSKIVPQMQAQQEAQVTAWTNESTTKYGKDGIEAANKALGRFSTPEFTGFLKETGLGNHPEMIGIFKEINSKISESSFVDSKTTETKPKTLGQIMYPDMKK
jgi:hypothetical protein